MTAESVLLKFVDTIEITGGVYKDHKGLYHPGGDPEWIDLGDVYIQACKVLGRETMVADDPDDIDEDEEDDTEIALGGW